MCCWISLESFEQMVSQQIPEEKLSGAYGLGSFGHTNFEKWLFCSSSEILNYLGNARWMLVLSVLRRKKEKTLLCFSCHVTKLFQHRQRDVYAYSLPRGVIWCQSYQCFFNPRTLSSNSDIHFELKNHFTSRYGYVPYNNIYTARSYYGSRNACDCYATFMWSSLLIRIWLLQNKLHVTILWVKMLNINCLSCFKMCFLILNQSGVFNILLRIIRIFTK